MALASDTMGMGVTLISGADQERHPENVKSEFVTEMNDRHMPGEWGVKLHSLTFDNTIINYEGESGLNDGVVNPDVVAGDTFTMSWSVLGEGNEVLDDIVSDIKMDTSLMSLPKAAFTGIERVLKNYSYVDLPLFKQMPRHNRLHMHIKRNGVGVGKAVDMVDLYDRSFNYADMVMVLSAAARFIDSEAFFDIVKQSIVFSPAVTVEYVLFPTSGLNGTSKELYDLFSSLPSSIIAPSKRLHPLAINSLVPEIQVKVQDKAFIVNTKELESAENHQHFADILFNNELNGSGVRMEWWERFHVFQFVREGLQENDVPIMITFSGQYNSYLARYLGVSVTDIGVVVEDNDDGPYLTFTMNLQVMLPKTMGLRTTIPMQNTSEFRPFKYIRDVAKIELIDNESAIDFYLGSDDVGVNIKFSGAAVPFYRDARIVLPKGTHSSAPIRFKKPYLPPESFAKASAIMYIGKRVMVEDYAAVQVDRIVGAILPAPASYKNPDSLIQSFCDAFLHDDPRGIRNVLKISYNEATKRFLFAITDHTEYLRLDLSKQVAALFGFESEKPTTLELVYGSISPDASSSKTVESNPGHEYLFHEDPQHIRSLTAASVTSPYTVNLSFGVDNIYVETDVIDPVVWVGNKNRNILGVVPIDFSTKGYNLYTPHDAPYVRINKEKISSIRLALKDYTGKRIKFTDDPSTVVAQLHFTRFR